LCELHRHNGSDGLKVYSTGIADAVILDSGMPLMNSGVVAAQMRQIKGENPFILLAGYSIVPDENVALFDHFIAKGCSPSNWSCPQNQRSYTPHVDDTLTLAFLTRYTPGNGEKSRKPVTISEIITSYCRKR
jgi:CheY-like chemotaxis protein